VEVNGLPYLVLGKTTTEYEVGEKVLVECEELVVDPANMVVGIKGLEVVGRGNGHEVDSLVGLVESEKAYTSVIIALVPHIPIATRLAQTIKGALPIGELHVTLTHMGKARSLAPYRQAIEDILWPVPGGRGRWTGRGSLQTTRCRLRLGGLTTAP
jgi:hypothetical protein